MSSEDAQNVIAEIKAAFQSDDFLIDILVYQLSGQSIFDPVTKPPLGLEMRNGATRTESRAICSFLIWLRSSLRDDLRDKNLVLAASLWGS